MSIALSADPAAGPFAEPVNDADRHIGIAMHLTPLLGFLFGPAILAPLVLWLIRKNDSSFVDDHGREMNNALISFVIYHIVAIITVIGIIALPVLYIIGIVSLVRGAIAAGQGDLFRYPMTMRFL